MYLNMNIGHDKFKSSSSFKKFMNAKFIAYEL